MEDFRTDADRYEPTNALWLGRAAQLSYEGEEMVRKVMQKWGMESFQWIAEPGAGVRGFIVGNGDLVIVSFSGVEPVRAKEWKSVVSLEHVDGPGGEVNRGFHESLMALWGRFASEVDRMTRNGQRLWFTGHGIGASLATLAAALLEREGDCATIQGIYTFGQPRTGSHRFAQWFNERFPGRMFRFVNNEDIVPHIPLPVHVYKHVGIFLHFNGQGDIQTGERVWGALKERLEQKARGVWEDRLVPSDLFDHPMERYLMRLVDNVNVNPFR